MRQSRLPAVLALFLVLSPALASAQVTGSPPAGSPGRMPPASDIDFVPEDAAHTNCPPFGPCPAMDQITTQYIGFGVDFTPVGAQPPVGVFVDPPEAWAGVNAMGNLDLITDVFGVVVVPGTTTPGATDLLAVEAGFVGGPNDILLEAFNSSGMLVGSSIGDDGLGDDGRNLAIVDLTGTPVIASFRVSTPTNDGYGVRHIYLNTPVALVPSLPWAALLALALGLAALGTWVLRRRALRWES